MNCTTLRKTKRTLFSLLWTCGGVLCWPHYRSRTHFCTNSLCTVSESLYNVEGPPILLQADHEPTLPTASHGTHPFPSTSPFQLRRCRAADKRAYMNLIHVALFCTVRSVSFTVSIGTSCIFLQPVSPIARSEDKKFPDSKTVAKNHTSRCFTHQFKPLLLAAGRSPAQEIAAFCLTNTSVISL